jgi:tetratricopeptide (TPR) repeat protein
MRHAVPLLVALAIVAAPFAPARAAGDAVATAVAGSEAEARGDFDAWLAELTAAAARAPDSPFAAAALAKARALAPIATDPTVVEKTLEPLLARGVADGEIDEALRDALADRARARGEFEKADAIGQNRGYLRRFAVAGPFGSSSSALVHRRFAPEKRDLDLTSSMEGALGPVRWIAMPVLGDEAWISPMDQIRRGQGVVYALGRVKSATARTVALKAFCSDSFAVFVNASPAIVADREHDFVPAGVWATARLEAGWNRILVKVAGRASFALKLCDPATAQPVLDVEEGDPLAAADLPASTGDAEPRTYRTPSDRALEAGKGDVAGSVAAAYMCDDEGRDWDAHLAFQAATAAVGAEKGALAANTHAAFGRFLAGFREFPEVQRKLRAKEQFAAAVAARPAHNSAAVRLAEYENEDDHPDKAVKALREQIKTQPTSTAWMAVARIARQRSWDREALDAAEHALECAPRNADALRFLIDVDRRLGNSAKADERNDRLLAIDANDGGAADQKFATLRAQGKHEEALALARAYAKRWPSSLGWRAQAAAVLQAMGRDDEALAAWKELAALVPADAGYVRNVAQILEGKGDDAGALENYKKSLAAEPFQPPVWRAVARLEGNDTDFGAPFEPNVDDLLKQLPPTEELKKRYPKAVAITVLDHDVTRVREDGSSQVWIHMVYKLLDEKGVKKYGDERNAGDLLEIRAILPDGTVMTPTGLPGRSYNMEGLVAGTVIDHRYLLSQRAGPKGYDGGLFFFQDSEVQDEPNPVMLSRFVVVAPASMKLDPVKRNYEGDPAVETKDGMTVTTWEKRDVPRLEPERNMPNIEEIVPLVDYSRPESVEDVNWNLLSMRDNSRPTPMLADAVAKAVKDGMSDLEKLHAIYDWVNDEITGEDGGGEGPTATLLAKAGDRGQLFEALVRTAGIPYRNGRAIPWNGETQGRARSLDADAFALPFLWLEPRGAEPVPFVMLGRLAPFGLLPDAYRGSTAFITDEQGGSIRRLPAGGPSTQNSSSFEIRLGTDAKSVRVAGSVFMRGANDYEAKREVIEAPEDDRKKWAESTLNRYFASPSLEKVEFPRLDKRGESFEMALEGTMSNYVQPQGETYVVGLGLPRIDMGRRFVEKAERVYDLVLNSRDDRLDEFTIHLGDAFSVKTLPDDLNTFHRLGTYSLTWRLVSDREGGDRIVVRREVHLHPARYRADEYKAFVAWCKSIDEAEERKLELRKVK